MRMQTTAGHLRTGLRLFRGIIDRRNTIPVLGTVRLAAGQTCGTDLDVERPASPPTIGKMEGAAAIAYAGLSLLVGSLDGDEELEIAEANHSATVGFNGSEYRMASCAAADF